MINLIREKYFFLFFKISSFFSSNIKTKFLTLPYNDICIVKKVKLSPDSLPFQNKMSLQQEQFCQLTERFFKNMDKAIASRNDIRVNMVHQERQENLDALIPSGKINNWIFKVVKIEQVENGSAAVVLSLQCNVQVLGNILHYPLIQDTLDLEHHLLHNMIPDQHK